MIEFIRKLENLGNKINRVNLIFIIKSINLQLLTLSFYGDGDPLWSKAIFRTQSIYREVYDLTYWHKLQINISLNLEPFVW